MSAITVSRQMGSRGDELALQVAGRLGWQRVCRDLINQAARSAGVPQVALAEIDELGFLGLRPSAKEWRVYQSQVERIIRDLADGGNVVIVGRGGQVVLHDRPMCCTCAWYLPSRCGWPGCGRRGRCPKNRPAPVWRPAIGRAPAFCGAVMEYGWVIRRFTI